MTLNEIKETLLTEDYDFLREHKKLGDNIILLCLGGSHAYGTNNEDSDLDIRGVAKNSKQEILLGNDFEQVHSDLTDTTIYSFRKIVFLLSKCNPSIIECLGCKPEHYLYLSDIGQQLLDNKKIFLSQIAVNSFGGYANQQLYRLTQKSKNKFSQAELEDHILRTLKNQMTFFNDRYANYGLDDIKLFLDISHKEEFDKEIFMNFDLKHYPLRDFCSLYNELNNTVKQYNKIGKRNSHAFEHNKIGKHMMHLIRLYLMCFDILEKEEIVTYREKDHDMLMDIRNGKYLENDKVLPEFFEMVNEYEKRLEYDKENTSLPVEPNYDEINDFIIGINEMIVKGYD